MTAASMVSEAQVDFPKQERHVKMPVGRTLLDAALAARLQVSNICAGRGVCGKCRLEVISGGENLSPVTDLERMSISEQDIEQGFRVACCATITKAALITVHIPTESLAEGYQLLVAGIQPKVQLLPSVQKYFLRLPRASLRDFRSDSERVRNVLESESTHSILHFGFDAIKELPETIRKGEWAITATVSKDGIITWVDAGQTDGRLFGYALDLGTTKLAGYLVDLISGNVVAKASMTNPQTVFGSDVISRISHVSKSSNGLDELQEMVIEAANSLIQECCAEARVAREEVFHLVVVGNTAMHHIFMGIQPKYVALAPYPAVVRSSLQIYAKEVGIRANPGSLLTALPCVAGFVGADAVAGILATEIHKSPSLALLVDIGTNTEIILGDKKRLLSCSSPSGPAFEGAHIRHGMRAENGAIEKVWITPQTFEAGYSTIGDEKPRGLCGSAVIDCIAGMRRTGLIDVQGRIGSTTGSKRVRLENGKVEYVIAWREETQTGRDIVMTQGDVEEVKLAKAAVYSGIIILSKHLGVKIEDISRVFLAGAFGTYMDPFSARTIGMYPDIPLGRISFVGNTAGSGARMALLSKEKCTEAQKIADTLEYIELAADPNFQREFVDALYIPHKHSAGPIQE